MNPKVDFFFEKPTKWQQEYNKLRTIILECLPASPSQKLQRSKAGQVGGLTEELKWGKPCYTYQGKNILLIHGFKDYCALLFHKGALLMDTNGILIQQTEHVQAARQIRFTDISEIEELQATIKAYIFEAVEIEIAGLEVEYKKTSEFNIPQEFQEALDNDPDLKAAFEELTPGRQRGYLLYFSRAKQSRTRSTRVEKFIPKILEGRGLDD